jgi:hypothetical protein
MRISAETKIKMNTATTQLIDAAFEMVAATKKAYPVEGTPEFFALTDTAHRLECACIAYKQSLAAPRPPASVDAGTPRMDRVAGDPALTLAEGRALEREVIQLTEVDFKNAAHIDKLQEERDSLRNNLEGARRVNCRLTQESFRDADSVAALTAQLSSLAVQLEEAKKERDEFVGTMNELSMALLNKKAECARIRESLDGFALSAMDGNGEIGRLKAAIEMLNRDKTEMAEHFDEALIERDAHWTGEYKEAHRQISALRSALAEKEKDYAKLCQANVGLADGAIESLQGVRTLRARLAALEEDKRRLQTLENAARDLVIGDHMNIGFDYLLQRCDSMGAGVLKARLLALRSALSSENPRTLREGEEQP